MMLGHLILRPSNQRMYSISAMGDLRIGEPGSSPLVELDGDTECPEVGAPEEDGRPEMSSWTSVTTRPFAVISLLRIMRLWGNKPRDVWTCWRTAELLEEFKNQ